MVNVISAALHYATESDVEALRSIFDPVVYAEENPDVVALVGNDPEALFANFRDYGVYQGNVIPYDPMNKHNRVYFQANASWESGESKRSEPTYSPTEDANDDSQPESTEDTSNDT